MIRLEQISKVYRNGDNEVWAIKNVNLRIAAGEFVAVMGPSGSGKSTTMGIMGLLDRASSGHYFLNGRDVTTYSDAELAKIRNLELAFIFQSFHLLPKLTALENVELPLIYRGLPIKERRARAKEALEKVGLAARISHRPKELSGGQQQRVAIARALAGDPRIILADEPTGNLDSKSGREIMTLFEDLNRQGITIVLVTHEEEIAHYARRIIRFMDGEIISDQVTAGGKEA
ncbi:MAG TPA: ABC transporter ATP-binding protein [Firmicutes bacterium]|jgi:putative ABC transport system ATP-binding protein|nr:ABC transporter ATP-binding protein [Bacillota bacterium]HOQ24793.1 ABC transporter ATP-binding protein [Bacillota bacterium]HPT68025.1 ABC transporter ATP-binding protein [Bacillota bacterium]